MDSNLEFTAHQPSSSTNPNCLPHNSTPVNPVVSSNPSSSDKFKILTRKPNQRKTLTLTSPLSAQKKPKKEKISAIVGPVPPCSECGKTFKSAKALYGHMRCHPERKWRGMKNPAIEPVNPELSKYELEEIQAVKNLLLISKSAYEDWMGGVKKKFSEKRNGTACSFREEKKISSELNVNLAPSMEIGIEEGGANGHNSNPNPNLNLELRLGF